MTLKGLKSIFAITANITAELNNERETWRTGEHVSPKGQLSLQC